MKGLFDATCQGGLDRGARCYPSRVLIACPECERKVSDRAKACPDCGFPVSEHVAEAKAGLQRGDVLRAINGEVRLWVNGEEGSGGTDISPRTGYLCLESEGSPVEFRNLTIRILP